MDMPIACGVNHERAHGVDKKNGSGIFDTGVLDNISRAENLLFVTDGGVRHAANPFLEFYRYFLTR